ncbi:hypothetical protein JJ691_17490 [Kutzneria sp. CA-103260]|nr:hypothetical protein JJ691_17490 [Kutzneria sp. CA-103260]
MATVVVERLAEDHSAVLRPMELTGLTEDLVSCTSLRAALGG